MLSRLLIFIGRIVYKIGWKLTLIGNYIRMVGRRSSKSFKTAIAAENALNHCYLSPSNTEKDKVIAMNVRKGGCEVQTGVFRRVDCAEASNV